MGNLSIYKIWNRTQNRSRPERVYITKGNYNEVSNAYSGLGIVIKGLEVMAFTVSG